MREIYCHQKSDRRRAPGSLEEQRSRKKWKGKTNIEILRLSNAMFIVLFLFFVCFSRAFIMNKTKFICAYVSLVLVYKYNGHNFFLISLTFTVIMEPDNQYLYPTSISSRDIFFSRKHITRIKTIMQQLVLDYSLDYGAALANFLHSKYHSYFDNDNFTMKVACDVRIATPFIQLETCRFL